MNRHDLANSAPVLRAWCLNPGCAAPIDPEVVVCLECGHGQVVTALLQRKVPAARPCGCTDGRRIQPLINCPHCRGEGLVR